MNELHDHYLSLIDRWQREADSYKAKLFDAWNSLRMQQKGLNRQARKIKRLQAEIAKLKAPKPLPPCLHTNIQGWIKGDESDSWCVACGKHFGPNKCIGFIGASYGPEH